MSQNSADRFKDRLIDEGYNPAYCARPLRRAIMRLLEDILAEEMLSDPLKDGGGTPIVDIGEDGKAVVTPKQGNLPNTAPDLLAPVGE